jgi:hypothetical protein
MKIKRIPTISEPIFLAEISEEFKELEGEVTQDQKAWVRVRQATEGDSESRAALQSKRRIEYNPDSTMTEMVDENIRTRLKFEVWWTLDEVGNLTWEDGDPIFKKGMSFKEFEDAWKRLDVRISLAIHKAVRITNPNWDWDRPAQGG